MAVAAVQAHGEKFVQRIRGSISALRKIEYGEPRPSTQIAELMANCLDVLLEERSTLVRVAQCASQLHN